MHHAIGATRVIPRTALFPRRGIDHFSIRFVVIIRDDVAGALPPARVERGSSPGRTLQFAFPPQKFQVNRRNHQVVLIEQPDRLTEFFADVRARHENILRLHCGVAVGGRKHVSVDTQRV